MKLRADQLLVERGLCESRARAQAAIAAGLVTADGDRVRKASQMLAQSAVLSAQAPHPYVSRGGLKLAEALDLFGYDPSGRVCLDVGASTGGFTDLLLKRGARHVVSVDVGRDQLHASLRGDPRVTSLEACDIRSLTPADLPEEPTLAAIDVSFISLRLVLPAVAGLLAPDAQIAALIKPQFEAGRAALKKGIVRDEAVHQAVCADVAILLGELGFAVQAPIPSPIEGGDGNREFLIGGQRAG
ncbi:MAG TPA: TlyA family RNA methyltransferase [Bosea sp. (in: a-proteobacteria)]|jgi:23S rRNA (cytidine1920-2'-O)/16S rRNA (cytidine1409-2'-O)-methyltransferase|uniref:TlyA family RNA methyltransferase n=1 Tax=Bosea sp. (in: a-proteobacteria) TaxID=1871050 RepID=UPI002DDD1EAC|nr:TlyA family RNA methyltransferase [Bosea sp. (in: a-proteobacteria)]HEV2553768.1 TlyA family RNA methyltransferase [Bosea sp. (in: a-proteobacteria)]